MQNNVPFFSEDLRNYYYSRNTSPFSYFNSRADYIYTHDFKKQCDKAHSLLPTSELLKTAAHLDDLSRMLYVDTKTWLPDDLFIKADKMTMANSVELRVPLLDHKLLEYAASIPGSYKVRGMDTKYILKQTLSKLVPRQIIERKKAGFPVPYEKWLRTGMRDYVKDLLLDGKTTQRGYFEKKEIEELIQNNETASQHNKEIFSLLVLELWHRIFVDSEPNDRNMFHMDAAGHEGSK
jgi:asparagine synthase (glutamine-hydrolysing)